MHEKNQHKNAEMPRSWLIQNYDIVREIGWSSLYASEYRMKVALLFAVEKEKNIQYMYSTGSAYILYTYVRIYTYD